MGHVPLTGQGMDSRTRRAGKHIVHRRPVGCLAEVVPADDEIDPLGPLGEFLRHWGGADCEDFGGEGASKGAESLPCARISAQSGDVLIVESRDVAVDDLDGCIPVGGGVGALE